MAGVPDDYLTRVYAGVLGKLIGVYLGRPFEGWTHEQILKELGHVDYYVHEHFGLPLVVTDDDVAGSKFSSYLGFIMALWAMPKRCRHGIQHITSVEVRGNCRVLMF
jgi:hypothetical protein